MLFAFSLPSLGSVSRFCPFRPMLGQFFILSLFLVHQGAASLRVESLGPYPLLPQTLPWAQLRKFPIAPLPPLRIRRLAQRSKAQFRRELQGRGLPHLPQKTSTLAPHPFSRGAEFDSEFIPRGRVIYSSNIPTSAGMMEPIKMLGDCFYD